MNETKFWLDGVLWGTVIPSGVDSGTTKYWLNGVPYISVEATTNTVTNTSNFFLWFY